MKKIQIYLIVFLTSLFFSYSINSTEIEIYKKIDLFGEVLETINKEYRQSPCRIPEKPQKIPIFFRFKKDFFFRFNVFKTRTIS